MWRFSPPSHFGCALFYPISILDTAPVDIWNRLVRSSKWCIRVVVKKTNRTRFQLWWHHLIWSNFFDVVWICRVSSINIRRRPINLWLQLLMLAQICIRCFVYLMFFCLMDRFIVIIIDCC